MEPMFRIFLVPPNNQNGAERLETLSAERSETWRRDYAATKEAFARWQADPSKRLTDVLGFIKPELPPGSVDLDDEVVYDGKWVDDDEVICVDNRVKNVKVAYDDKGENDDKGVNDDGVAYDVKGVNDDEVVNANKIFKQTPKDAADSKAIDNAADGMIELGCLLADRTGSTENRTNTSTADATDL